METGKPSSARQHPRHSNARKPARPLSLLLICLYALAALVPIVGLPAGVALLELGGVHSEARERSGTAEAAGHAAMVSGRVSALLTQADLLAEDAEAVAALISGDPARIKASAAALKGRLQHGLLVELVAAGAPPAPDEKSPLGFAAIELLERAQSGGRPALEVHRFGGPLQAIAVARPVKVGGSVVGAALFAVDVALLKELVGGGAHAVEGLLEIRQKSGDLVLASIGDSALNGGASFRAPVVGTEWQVVYWPATAADGGLPLALLITLAVAVLLAAGVMVAMGKFLERTIQNDLTNLVRLALSRRGPARAQPLRLAEFQRVAEEVERKRTASRSSMLTTPGENRPVQPVSDLLFMPGDAVEVEETGQEPLK